MQEVGWVPIQVDYRPPWMLRVFVLYSFVVLVVALVKSVRLARELQSFSAKKRLARLRNGNGQEKCDLLAAFFMAHGLPRILRLGLGGIDHSLFPQAEGKFLYLWEVARTRVVSLRRLVVLTSALSAFTFIYLAIANLNHLAEQKISGIGAISGSAAEALAPLQIGAFVCAFLYAAYSFSAGVLRRRKASWDYFFASRTSLV